MKDLKIMKTIKGRIKLIAAGTALGTGLLFTSCEVVTPDGQTIVVDENGNVTVPTNPEPTTPVEPEVIETDPVEPEEVEPEVVEVAEPKFILYDEDGNYYKPQHVTADDIYTRIAEVEEKYEFENDWERDVYVSNLVACNAGCMDKSDMEKIFFDYLANLQYKVIQQQLDYFYVDIYNNENKIPMSEYFIDPVLAEEAATIENYMDSKSPNMTAEKYNKFIKEIKEEKNIETYDFEMYNDLTILEYYVLNLGNIGKNLSDYFSDENCINYENNSRKVYTGLVYKNSGEFENYSISDYVSSHQDEKVK